MFRLPVSTIMLAFSLLIPKVVGGQPSIHGNLSGDLGPGEYIVGGDCQVLYEDTLRIHPGTTFLHTGYYTWQIQGQLLSEGTEAAPIRFQRLDPLEEHRWGGFQFFLGIIGQSVFRWCYFDHCKKHNYPDDCGAAIYLGHVSVIISNCTFTNGYATFGGAIYADNSDSLLIDSCQFQLNNAASGGAIYLNQCTGAMVSNCYIGQNESESS